MLRVAMQRGLSIGLIFCATSAFFYGQKLLAQELSDQEFSDQELSDGTEVESWPLRFQEKLDTAVWQADRALDRGGLEVAEAIFESLEDVELLDYDLNDDTNIRVGISRQVFDNRDPLNSYTVVDTFTIRARFILMNEVLENFGSDGAITLKPGFTPVLEFQDIRQVWSGNGVRPANLPSYDELESPEEREAELRENINTAVAEVTHLRGEREALNQTGEDLAFSDPALNEGVDLDEYQVTDDEMKWKYLPEADEGDHFSLFTNEDDPEMRSAFGRLDRILTVPWQVLKIATGIDRVEDMEEGQIISFLAHGTLPIGPKLRWSDGGLDVSAWARVFITGLWRVTVVKRAPKKVRLKFSTVYTNPLKVESLRELWANIGTEWGFEIELFDLFGHDALVVLDYDILDSIDIEPLEINWSEMGVDSSTTVYDYDLEQPAAREAYGRALWGLTGLSDRLAMNYSIESQAFVETTEDLQPHQDTGVRKSAEMISQDVSTFFRAKTKLGFLYESGERSQFEAKDATIIYPDGARDYVSARSINQAKNKFLWIFKDESRYEFDLGVDVTAYENEQPNPMSLVVDVDLRGFNQSVGRHLDATLMVEDMVGRHGLLPRLPDDYGRSGRTSHGVQLALSREQLDQVMNQDVKCDHLEEGFGVGSGTWCNRISRVLDSIFRTTLIGPLSFLLNRIGVGSNEGYKAVHFAKVLKRWEELQEYPADAIKERAVLLGSIFNTPYFSYEMVRLLRSVLQGQEIAYVVEAKHKAYGRIYERGVGVLDPANVATDVQKRIERDFRREGKRKNFERSPLSITAAHVFVDDRSNVEFHIVLKNDPIFEADKVHGMSIQLWRRSSYVPGWIPLLSRVPRWVSFPNNRLVIYKKGLFDPSTREQMLRVSAFDDEGPAYELLQGLEPGEEYKFRVSVSPDQGQHFGPTTDSTFTVPERFGQIPE